MKDNKLILNGLSKDLVYSERSFYNKKSVTSFRYNASFYFFVIDTNFEVSLQTSKTIW